MQLIYGKLIVDNIRQFSGKWFNNLLGGGGPQSTIGARLFTDSVGFLTRSGTDLEASHLKTLHGLGADLRGWHRFPDLQTPRTFFQYDQDQNLLGMENQPFSVLKREAIWNDLLAEDLTVPDAYKEAKGIHLVTEFSAETMIHQAKKLRSETGAMLSLEPLIDKKTWQNLDEMRSLIPDVDVVCPDLNSALALCNTEDPETAALELHRMGPKFVAIRAGSEGSYVAGHSVQGVVRIHTLEIDVIDPTGAGNAFSGAFAASLTEEVPLLEAACNATAAACAVLEVAGTPVYTKEKSIQARQLAKELLKRL